MGSDGVDDMDECMDAVAAWAGGFSQECYILCMYALMTTDTWRVGGEIVNQYYCCYGAYTNVPCDGCPGDPPDCSNTDDCPGGWAWDG
ncbi:MAG: hypothetical protein ABIJ56_11340 [Pseudomonadota bacterium]